MAKRTPTALKATILDGQSTGKHAPAVRFIVAEHGGQRWATDTHWLVPATLFGPMLDKYALPRDESFVAHVNGSFDRTGQDVPNLGALFDQVNGDRLELEPVLIGDRPGAVDVPEAGWCNVYTVDDERAPADYLRRVAIRADYLALVEDAVLAAGNVVTGYAVPRLTTFTGYRGGPRRGYGTKAVAVMAGELVVGLVMPVRVARLTSET